MQYLIYMATKQTERKTLNGWVIVTHEGRKQEVLPEGPWETREAAEEFGNAEVGAKWTVERLLFVEGDYCYLQSERGNQFVAPNGEVFTARRIRMSEGWSF